VVRSEAEDEARSAEQSLPLRHLGTELRMLGRSRFTLAASATGTGPLRLAIEVEGGERWFWGAQRSISGRLAGWSDHLGAGYRYKGLPAVGQVRT